jgi:carbonic anhydrase
VAHQRTAADRLLNSNEEYARDHGPLTHSAVPDRRLVILTCMDSRIDTFAAFGLERGEAQLIRNGGAFHSDDVVRSLKLSQGLGVTDLVVVQHTDCAAGKAEGHPDVDVALAWTLEKLQAEPDLKPLNIEGLVYITEEGRLRRPLRA